MQITRFIRQGFIIVKTGNDNILAAISPQKDEMVICCINNGETANTFRISVTGDNHIIKSGKVYQTNATLNCEELPSAKASGNSFTFNAENLSITTFVFPLLK
ncbi:MAG: hypothetical protein FWG22_02375 [Prolixibacteraceae bacterium]|nr:hypothetical protein [Prolixibacteraceae bacterium]